MLPSTTVSETWSVTAEVAAPGAEDASALLLDLGAAGVEERDATLAPMPGARQPAAGNVLLVAWFGDRAAAAAAAAALGPGATVEEVEARDWGEEWKRGLAPFSVGRVFLRPSWVEAPPPAGAAEVVLDPGMAFGTGAHPTTALCLEAVDAFVGARPGASVLDVGTGSGILAIAARKLGAGRVVGTDDDPVAVGVARENAARNGADVEIAGAPVEALAGTFDLVVANILANVLVALAPAIAAKVAPDGEVVLAGVLSAQEDEVGDAFRRTGLEPLPGTRRDEWSLLRFRRRA
jgi:ribosomal protein L11 methyltransferase